MTAAGTTGSWPARSSSRPETAQAPCRVMPSRCRESITPAGSLQEVDNQMGAPISS